MIVLGGQLAKILGRKGFDYLWKKGPSSISILASLNTYETTFDGMFEGCTHLYTVVFEEGIKVIPAYFLRDCGAENVYIPSSVTIVNLYAFLDCSNLENVYFMVMRLHLAIMYLGTLHMQM